MSSAVAKKRTQPTAANYTSIDTTPYAKLGPWPARPSLDDSQFFVFQEESGKWYAVRYTADTLALDRTRQIYLMAIRGLTKSKIPQLGIWFPVAPPEYQISRPSDWNEGKIIGLGTVAHPAGVGLTTVSWSCFFPGGWTDITNKAIPMRQLFFLEAEPGEFGMPSSVRYVQFLNKLMENQDVVQLSIRDAPLSIKARITDFTWGEVAGRPRDRTYSITFSEWREQKKLTIRRGVRYLEVPKTYRPQQYEDLRDISMRWYGTAAMWKKIAQINGLKVRPDAKLVPVNSKKKKPTVIKLPRP